MRTVRCCSRMLGGCRPGVCARGGVCPGVVVCTRHHIPCEQNNRHVWEHYFAATTLLTVVSVKQILATSHIGDYINDV